MIKMWSEEEITKLKELLGKGLSSTEIGKIIGRSRGSVIGVMHRNKIPSRYAEIKDKTQTKKRPSQKSRAKIRAIFASKEAKEPQHVEEPPPPPSSEHYVPFLDRRYGQCKFIVEKRNETHICCGTPATRNGWCGFHAAIVYRPFDPVPVKRNRNTHKPLSRP